MKYIIRNTLLSVILFSSMPGISNAAVGTNGNGQELLVINQGQASSYITG